MAANRFATMLHRNTNKITLILIYAVLEWILIVLLLLNSLFSYLIFRFANYFGLKPPCLWCSRLDHFFESGKDETFHGDHLCEVHAAVISKLGYCSNHQKLAPYQNMCEDCSSSRPDFRGIAKNFTFFPWVKEIGMIHNHEDKAIENGEVSLRCSCCGLNLENQIYSPYILINPSDLDVLKYTHKESLIIDEGENDLTKEDKYSDCFGSEKYHEFEMKSENLMNSNVNGGSGLRQDETEEDCSVSISKFELNGLKDEKVEMFLGREREFKEEKNSGMKLEDPVSDEAMNQACSKKDAPLEIQPQHLEFLLDFSGQQLVPIDQFNSTTEDEQIRFMFEGNQENADYQNKTLGSESEVAQVVGDATSSVKENLANFRVFESMEMEETENSLIFHVKECESEYDQVAITQEIQTTSLNIDDVQEFEAVEEEERELKFSLVSEEVSQIQVNDTEPEVSIETETAAVDVEEDESNALTAIPEEVSQIITNEAEAEVSIGTEIPDLNSTDELPTQDIVCLHEDPSTSSTDFHVNQENGSSRKSQETVELMNLSMCSELNGIDEEKIPDTPTSSENFHHLHKRLLLLDRKESGTEESLDGSLISEFEGVEGNMTVERLTSALRAERKALHAVYAELEEERSASAVAANQTMAMINRLQEEKASMQMEALQYQRMMEEQSEYDQEALQLLNELMLKREREKQELEKELEIYRKKVLVYEAKENMGVLRRSKDGSTRSGFSSASCSNAEDSDGLSIDLNQEAKEEDGFYSNQESGNHNTPVDSVLNLQDSLDEFEEERKSILQQLKVLEDKLFTLSEGEQHLEDTRPVEHFYEENGKYLDEGSDFGDKEVNGTANGFPKELNGKHHQERRIMGSKAKRLLPLFDAISAENENGVSNGHENGFDSAVTRFELEHRSIVIEEEVDQLYTRLQTLEADREFLKHCISSLNKGDKGMDLLQEILQHLRDLRNVELRVKNSVDGPLV